MNRLKTIMIIAGGSGGHVFPGLSVAHYLMDNGYKVVWLGTEDNIESKLVPKNGISIKFVCIQGFRGKKIYQKLTVLLFFMFFAMYQSLKIIKFWKPDVVLSMGGYVSGPSSLTAWLCGIPVVIHEQNKILGLTNRYLSFVAKKILQGFPGVSSRAITVGNPVRLKILSISDPLERLKNRMGPVRLLVIGGSKGAHIFNKVVPKIAEKLSNRLIIWHQSGEQDLEDVIRAYNKVKENNSYKVVSFIDNMDQAYAWADVVIARAGALTVSEIACVGLAAIFVPFDYHKDRQQYWNAMTLETVGAAKIVDQRQFTIDYISKILKSWNRSILLNMAQKAKIVSNPNSTQLVAQIVIQCLKK